MTKTAESLDQALAVLRKEKLRITTPRKALLELLVRETRPLSVEEIHHALGVDDYDLVTVYRSLETFERAGIIQRIMLEKGKNLFELMRHQHHHHHVICRKCHRAEPLDYCEAEKLEKLARDLGYTEISHVLELYGVCDECRG